VALLLGIDGKRYLGFRGLVRDARRGRDVSARHALEAFAFALDAARARSTLA
jgi:hypothetical protein